MSTPSLKSFFRERETQYQSNIENLKSRSTRIGWLRLILFLAYIAFCIYSLSLSKLEWVLGVSVVFAPLFGWLVRLHNKARFEREQCKHLIEINEDEIKRISGDLKSIYDGGYEADSSHPYAVDMDVFGRNSLFQLLNRSRLKGSMNKMASWLLNHESSKEVLSRQSAVKELSESIDFRQELTAYSYHQKDDDSKELTDLIYWLRNNLNGIDKPIFKVAKFFLPILSVSMIIGWWMIGLSYHWLLLPVFLNTLVLRPVFFPLIEFAKEFDQVHHRIRSYALSIDLINSQKFESKKLIEIQNELKDAGPAITSLSKILHFLQGRANLFYQPVNAFFVLDLYGFQAAVNWKKNYELRMDGWLKAIEELHVLSDIGSYAFANSDNTYPTVHDSMSTIKAVGIGHPLLKSQGRVYNDFEHEPSQKVGLITGSNMSGKSTFLRTVGVNLILAQMGAPVCAKEFNCPSIQLFSSMRTTDNLEESVSSFYAELKRLQQLLKSLKKGDLIYFMLDEILKGTNSEDRHKGAISLINQLIETDSMGLISTHDIELSEMSTEENRVINYSFNSIIDGDEIIFDYKLTDGVCQSFNASKLMQNMGIIK
ncbi:MutS-related protein [Reichenbachiella versicolor]|uniref:MutS-related protein n=1 Tax=Reichenbachiella versicolor TaxID=1821036 RepID=UPI000D6E8DDF|nr:hypothetical protein [Reichenbachiella versicolor]